MSHQRLIFVVDKLKQEIWFALRTTSLGLGHEGAVMVSKSEGADTTIDSSTNLSEARVRCSESASLMLLTNSDDVHETTCPTVVILSSVTVSQKKVTKGSSSSSVI